MKTLSNNLKVSLSPDSKNSGYFAVDILIKAGSVSEPQKYNGVAHFLEHLICRAVGELQKGWVKSMAIDSFNGHTQRNRTDYTFLVPASDIDLFSEVIGIITNFKLPPINQIQLERQVLLEEILESEEDEDYKFSKQSEEWLFMNSAYSLPIGGSTASLKNITPQALKEFYEGNYVSENIYVCVCGDFDKQKIQNALESISTISGKIKSQPIPELRQADELHVDDGKQQVSLEYNWLLEVNSVEEVLRLELAEYLLNDLIFYRSRQDGLIYKGDVTSLIMNNDAILYFYLLSSGGKIAKLRNFISDLMKNPTSHISESEYQSFLKEHISRLTIWNDKKEALAHNLNWYVAYFDFNFAISEISNILGKFKYQDFIDYIKLFNTRKAAIIEQGGKN